MLGARCTRVFDGVMTGKIKVRIGGECRLTETARAHAGMESRVTTGKLMLIR